MLKELHNSKQSLQLKFLKSALKKEGQFLKCDEVLEWIKKIQSKTTVAIDFIDLSDMKDWLYDKDSQKIRHITGKFFSIDGIEVRVNNNDEKCWRQPVINQPEVGYLGCLVKEFGGVLHFLVQAKIEPGNINYVQLSPTLQATRSNYSRVHGGKTPKYLDYFHGASRSRVLIDQLQSEQGARFLNKRNRNIVVETSDDIELGDEFLWLTLGQIKRLLSLDNVINMDLRTVISGISFDSLDEGILIELHEDLIELSSFGRDLIISATNSDRALFAESEIISWVTELKSTYTLDVKTVPLSEIPDWSVSEEGIFHDKRLYFDVRWVQVQIENREVSRWQQPMVCPRERGLIAFLVKKIDGIYHFLVQAKIECGNFDIIEFAPTVQCITGSYKDSLDVLPFLKYVLQAPREKMRFKSFLSEEGGRFYREQNLNMIIEVDDGFSLETPLNYKWISLNQLLSFVKYNNYLNIQSRSLLSVINYQ
jgi:dTDP-4-dehydro-6-deoxy-alpha-D-glucopyranose 2,3-dehydratase